MKQKVVNGLEMAQHRKPVGTEGIGCRKVIGFHCKTSTFTVIASTIMVFMEHSSDSLLWSKTSSHKKTNCLEANSDLLMRLECLVSAITFSEVIAIDVFLSCRLNPS